MAHPRILSVGQCGFDHMTISTRLRLSLGARVTGAGTAGEALEALRSDGPFDLVLVNRVGDRDGAPGLDLIRALKGDPALADLPVMLVSNYPDAQAEAVALGALPGFGKAQFGATETHQRLQAALGLKGQDT
jgi:two-component system chemotaxis response regulator CheY